MQSLGSHDRQHELWPAYPLRITVRPRILPHLGRWHKRTRLARTGSVVVHSDVGSGSGWLNDNGRERATIPVTTSGRGRNGASGGTDQLVWELCLPCDPETPAAAGEDRSGISLRENIHYENDTGRPQLTMVASFPYGASWSVYISELVIASELN